jgi:hypothetical protein
MEIPLPASTQWDVIAAYAPCAAPAYEALIGHAAQGDVMHNDDTTVKILELMGKRAKQQLIDVFDRFPDECEYVLKALKVVYRTDAEARKKKLSPAKRLRLHRTKSQQSMKRLHNWLKRQFDEKLVEPNSALGEAISYMLNHWEKLTRFLHVPGAPVDNNMCERALKKTILHRKNAYFYKTQRGARIGDMYMSLIYTCELCDANPFDYLTELHRNADRVADDPASWLPWNYQASVEASSAPVGA